MGGLVVCRQGIGRMIHVEVDRVRQLVLELTVLLT
jgi:hypothetical protein